MAWPTHSELCHGCDGAAALLTIVWRRDKMWGKVQIRSASCGGVMEAVVSSRRSDTPEPWLKLRIAGVVSGSSSERALAWQASRVQACPSPNRTCASRARACTRRRQRYRRRQWYRRHRWHARVGVIRVVAKARERSTREYAVRALSDLIVESVERLHPLRPSHGTKRSSSGAGSLAAPAASRRNASSLRGGAVAGAPPAAAPVPLASPSLGKRPSGGGSLSGGEGFGPMLLLPRSRSEESRGQESEEAFRWVFEGDLSGVFVAGERAAGASELGTRAGDEVFEGVVFETMRLFALTPHIDTREATLQTLYTILQVRERQQVKPSPKLFFRRGSLVC